MNNNRMLFKIIVGVLIIIGVFVLYKALFSNNKYKVMEENLINQARSYVINNNIELNGEVYLDAQKIGYTLDNNCSIKSGVLFDGNNYRAYLLCDNYESKLIDNQDNNIKLLGHEIEIIPKGITYLESGYVSNNEVDISGEVKDEVGVYNLRYSEINGSSLIRKVIVIDNMELYRYYPEIKLKGSEYVFVDKGSVYKDEGAEAYDTIDNDITSKIVVDNPVNEQEINTYVVIYKVTNTRGYTNSVKRTVNVTDQIGDDRILNTLIPNTKTNKEVSIILKVKLDEYSYTILPNGNKSKESYIVYNVLDNDIYKFTIYDKNGNSTVKEIEVNNIDKTAPIARCIARINYNSVTIEVTNDGEKTIDKYNYIINNTPSGYNKKNTYTKNINNVTSASVEVYDDIGNMNKVTCELKNEDPTIGNENIRYYTYEGNEYVVANTQNDLTTFVNATRDRISQTADKNECGDTCLSFSYYHAIYLQRRNISDMNLDDACHWKYNQKYDTMTNKTKMDAINILYNEIINGRVAVLQVTGTKKRTTRHFVTVVGYLRSKYNVSEITEEDLLCIDAWTGDFVTLSYDDLEKRTMFDNKDGYGYRVDIFNRSKWQ